MTNRLAKETSPYLQQHQNNPVDWYPWGSEALNRAKNENKPILLSIGYSACHWCHVMEQESFENPEIAKLMNDYFVSIKVDREERPDLDQIYQNVAQALTRGGGWPLTVFLTPDLKPFFGGTYFPPQDRFGRPGFSRVLQSLADAYQNERSSIDENAEKLVEFMSRMEPAPPTEKAFPTASDFDEVAKKILARIDWENGGFGDAPKFPNPMLLSFLWRYGIAKGSAGSAGDSETAEPRKQARQAVILTLKKMAEGGIYDQLGGGFHRYSVDRVWGVPHFEKMLYDNALLLKLYSEVLLSGGEWMDPQVEDHFLEVLRETKNYLLREMRSPQGLFYSAQDADTEGEEGKFFVWTPQEIKETLSPEEYSVFALRFGVVEGGEGNFEGGKVVLGIQKGIQEISQTLKLDPTEILNLLDSAKKKLLKVRSQRAVPALDNKALSSWNGLMVSGLAWTAQVFQLKGITSEATESLKAAEEVFNFILTEISDKKGRLSSTYQSGQKKLNAYLDDYATLMVAALDLARFSSDPSATAVYVEAADQWSQVVLAHFRDLKASCGFYFTSDDHESLIYRPRSLYDQAVPAGTPLALACMTILADFGWNISIEHYRQEVEKQLPSIFKLAKEHPYGFGESLCLAFLLFQGSITVSGQGAEQLCWHPHIFQKPREKGQKQEGISVCFRQTCSAPTLNTDEALAHIRQIIQGSLGGA